jgi:hypothetical protein
MNSLEFIEKEIKQLEERKENTFKNEYYSIYKECSQKITALQQIKAELEAWEVCKNDPVILSTIKTLAKGESINWHRLSEKQRGFIKKALEVEDGKSN